MIGRHLRQGPVAQAINTRITDVCQSHRLPVEHRHDYRGAHACVHGTGSRLPADRLIGVAHSRHHQGLVVLLPGTGYTGAEYRLYEALHSVHRQRARYLTGIVSPHAVGEQHQAEISIPVNGVFVVIAHATHVGLSANM